MPNVLSWQTRDGDRRVRTDGVARADAVARVEALESRALFSAGTGDNEAARALIGLDALLADPAFDHLDGSGWSVAVLDTGIDLDHPFFGPDTDANGVADRIVHHHDFAQNDSVADDTDGHGSNLAGIIGSGDSTYPGVAPGVNLIVLKVFNSDDGTTQDSHIRAALQWVRDNADTHNIAAVNLSFGFGRFASQLSGAYSTELNELVDAGIIPIASAGNGFHDDDSALGVAYPAADPNAIAVGAVWAAAVGGPFTFADGATDFATGPDRIISFSQRHPDLIDVFAPGGRITHADFDGTTVTEIGTSQAAAYVAGVAALAQQLAHEQLGRRLTFAEFRDLIRQTGASITDGDDEEDNVNNTGFTYKRLDAHALAEAVVEIAIDSSWELSTGDLNGDGKTDFLYRNQATGQNKLQIMNGTTVASTVFLPGAADPDWHVAALADVNGDNKDDIIWRHHGDGTNAVWYMNGVTRTRVGFFRSVTDHDWKLGGAGDFTGDGNPDLLWHNTTTGANGVWVMNDTTRLGVVMIKSSAPDWELTAAADFDGDDDADILWRSRTTGATGLWTMNETAFVSGHIVWNATPSAWIHSGARDVNGDGTDDILWYSADDQLTGVWYMQGPIRASATVVAL